MPICYCIYVYKYPNERDLPLKMCIYSALVGNQRIQKLFSSIDINYSHTHKHAMHSLYLIAMYSLTTISHSLHNIRAEFIVFMIKIYQLLTRRWINYYYFKPSTKRKWTRPGTAHIRLIVYMHAWRQRTTTVPLVVTYWS